LDADTVAADLPRLTTGSAAESLLHDDRVTPQAAHKTCTIDLAFQSS
jgi:hypothetical protein